jgi:asparagine synthase (glutamine-hydrolysing)
MEGYRHDFAISRKRMIVMCGVAGVFAFDRGGPINPIIVSRLNERERRRGPDGTGLWAADDKRVVLGNRRLAIVDRGDDGAQPMSDATGRWVLHSSAGMDKA